MPTRLTPLLARGPRALALTLALTLGACAGPRYVYDKPRTTIARRDDDLASCRKEAFRPARFAIFSSQRYDQDVINKCMERKGYSVIRPP